MKLLNRMAISLTPLQPYADWVNGLPSDFTELDNPASLEDFRSESRVYLIDESESTIDQLLADEMLWRPLLENELSAWDEFGDYWPELTAGYLTQWFSIQLLAVAFDAASEPLLLADLA